MGSGESKFRQGCLSQFFVFEILQNLIFGLADFSVIFWDGTSFPPFLNVDKI